MKDMVGIFSKFSGSRTSHRRTQSAVVGRETLPGNPENAAAAAGSLGIETTVDFKPVEHPVEPSDNDRPIPCPLPEPSILHDGRIWKERISAATSQRRPGFPPAKERGSVEFQVSDTKQRLTQSKPLIPSFSAPEHNIMNLLDGSNSSAT